jgi:hypothetical protein
MSGRLVESIASPMLNLSPSTLKRNTCRLSADGAALAARARWSRRSAVRAVIAVTNYLGQGMSGTSHHRERVNASRIADSGGGPTNGGRRHHTTSASPRIQASPGRKASSVKRQQRK